MAGRPTDLNQELIDRAKEYLPTCISIMPTIEGLALYLRVHKDNIYEWCKHNDDLGSQFSDVFEEIKNTQGMRLINGGLYNRLNPTITKLMLSKHGYIEKTATDLTNNGKDLPTPILGGISGIRRDDSTPQDSSAS